MQDQRTIRRSGRGHWLTKPAGGAVELGRFDQGVCKCDCPSATLGADKEVILAPDGNRAFILPMFGYYVEWAMASAEVQPGLTIKIAAWTLGPATCAAMETDAPRAFVAALCDLLPGQGFRQSPFDDRAAIGKKGDEVFGAPTEAAERTLPTERAPGRAEVEWEEPEGMECGPWCVARLCTGESGVVICFKASRIARNG